MQHGQLRQTLLIFNKSTEEQKKNTQDIQPKEKNKIIQKMNKKRSEYYLIKFRNTFIQFTILLFVLQNIFQSNCVAVGPFRPTRHYEPQHIEAGTHDFTNADDILLFPNAMIKARFTVNLIRLQLLNSNTYHVATNFAHYNYIISNFTEGVSYFYVFAYNFNFTGFTIEYFAQDQYKLISVRTNYLAISSQYLQKQYIVIAHPSTFVANAINATVCDGNSGLVHCPFYITTNLPHVNYKMFFSLVSIILERDSNIALIPSFEFSMVSTTMTNCTADLAVEYFKIINIDFYAIFISNFMFSTTSRYEIMFTSIYSKITAASATHLYTVSFPYYVDEQNKYTIFVGHKGDTFKFNLNANTPPDTDLKGTLYSLNHELSIQNLGFYGMAYDCPSFVTAPCQECSKYCILCDVKPTFHCVQCEINFVLDVPQLNCSCPSPNIILSNLCDVFPLGCISAERLSNGTAVCIFCDPAAHLILNSTNQCQCINGFEFDSMSICQDYCGDGIIYTDQCDDGNSGDGDGCNSQCHLQPGFTCDVTIQPTYCKSQYLLDYQIDKIQKNEDLNRAKVYLKVSNYNNLPFEVKAENFELLASYFKLQLILTSNANNKMTIHQIQQFAIDPSTFFISFEFEYTFSIQNLKGQIALNYGQTRYQNYTQTLDFQLKGSNFPLIFQQNIATYKGIQTGMMVGTILNILCFIVGIITPKFIGLETILTLQLIFYSQLLIYDPSKWPPGFIFLKYLKLASGYNDIFTYTSYLPIQTVSKKFTHLQMYKSIIENFNINFAFLFLCFVVLIVACQLRTRKQKLIEEEKKTQKKFNGQQTSPIQNQSLFFEWKFNDIVFYISNQISHWLILPLIAAISAQLLITDAYNTNSSSLSVLLVDKIGRLIIFISIILILAISLNSFKNIWLSHSSLKIDFLRPEQNTYKRLLLLYQWMIGILAIIFNNIYIFGVLYMSIIVLLLQFIYLILLIWINPYKQSLRVHTICLIFNNVVYLAFLILINFINYVDGIPSLLVLVFGFFILFACVLSIILTVVRLFYELKYGRELQEKIQKQRELAQQRELQQKNQRLKKQSRFFQRQAQMRRSEAQKLRDRNIYLFQNQTKKQKQEDLIKWLKKRNWDQKLKQEEYFKQFQEKPLDQIKEQDPIKYQEKLTQLKQLQQKRAQRAIDKENNDEYRRTVNKLRKQVNKIKYENNSRYALHKTNMQQNTAYAMKMMIKDQQGYINKDYTIKQ